MTTITADYLRLLAAIDDAIEIPPIAEVWFPPAADTEYCGRFGGIKLADGSLGLVSVSLGATRKKIAAAATGASLLGKDPVAVAGGFGDADGVKKTIALGALNAIGQLVFTCAALTLPPPESTLAPLAATPSDTVGMVGFFPPLVARLRRAGIPLVVLELDPELQQRAAAFEVTCDPEQLARCNKILCTSTVLLNDTAETILAHSAHAQRLVVAGPGAGFLPDPLFSRGVTGVGASRVISPQRLLRRLSADEKWGDAAAKYHLEATAYPGFETLLERAARNRR